MRIRFSGRAAVARLTRRGPAARSWHSRAARPGSRHRPGCSRRVVLVRGEDQQHRVRFVAVLGRPDHRREVATRASGRSSRTSRRLLAVVDGDGDAAGDADQELVAHAMRVLAPHLRGRHVVDHEPAARRRTGSPPGSSKDPAVSLPRRSACSVKRCSVTPPTPTACVPAVVIGRGGLGRRRLVGEARVALDPRRVADHDRVGRHRAGHDGAGADHRADADLDARAGSSRSRRSRRRGGRSCAGTRRATAGCAGTGRW